MGRERKTLAAMGKSAKQKVRRLHKEAVRYAGSLQAGLVAKPSRPTIKSKHKTFFELVENTDKKKKLAFQVGASPQSFVDGQVSNSFDTS